MIRSIHLFFFVCGALLLAPGLAEPPATESFQILAKETYGEWGEQAARFLTEHMPEQDRKNLSAEFLLENLEVAVRAREEFPWAKGLPDDIFFNHVLPYAVFDEPRDPWRKKLYEIAKPLVADATTAREAAQRLNRDLFNAVNTHYSRERAKANQSPQESIDQGNASCTGLSILLVAACRSVGIPARAVGTPRWWDDSGNHTWVEIWDGEWWFAGADEYTPKGLNHGWFVANAARADAGNPAKAIYATSWKNEGGHFPMVWSPGNQTVAGINITERYVSASSEKAKGIGVRLWDGGKRVATTGWCTLESGYRVEEFQTRAGKADVRDVPRIELEPGRQYRWAFRMKDTILETQPFHVDPGDTGIMDVQLSALKPAVGFTDPDRALTREEAARGIAYIYDSILADRRDAMEQDLKRKTLQWGTFTMPWLETTYGDAPHGERSLWISMHGGGGAPKHVNDRQWANQAKLYQPEEGIYLAPRAPTNTWNLWHQGHIDPLFNRLIEMMVALRGVDPDKVYLMGYSAGGDGVWQVAPRMADRFAAASMMAGHPNEAKMLGLRNLPFGIFCGEHDAAYNRNTLCAQRMRDIAEMAAADPDPAAYVHMTRLYKGMGHWMSLKDAESVPWMAGFTRQTWPRKIVWYQDDVTHDRFYWLEVPEGTATKGHRIDAEIKGQTITLKGDIPNGMRLLLNDALLDLDREVTVTVNDGKPTRHQPKRCIEVIRDALEKRLDPKSTPNARIILDVQGTCTL